MTTDITLRSVKGSPLTYTELDDNFSNLKETADAAADAVAAVGGKANASAVGIGVNDTSMGTFTGSTIPDSSTAKQGMQALETAVELAELKSDVAILQLASYGSLTYLSPTTTSYTTRQTATDITATLISAIAAATSRLNSGLRYVVIRIPSGLWTISSAVTIPNGVIVQGAGDGVTTGATHIRTIQTTGNTFNLGDPAPGQFVFNAGIMDMMIYQDHGGAASFGYENPVAASFINKATSGAHIYANYPRKCIVKNITTYGKNKGLYIFGGVQSVFSHIDINGIWDSASSARQEGLYGIDIDGDGSNIPTWHFFDNVVVGGQTTAGATVNYPGPNSKVTVLNIGFQYGVRIVCAEEVYFNNTNISACQKSDVLLTPASTTIIQGVQMRGTLSPCGTDIADAYIKCENLDATGYVAGFLFDGEMLGQGNGFRAVSDYGSTGSNGSFASIIIRGKISSFVGNPIYLTNARHVLIDSDIFHYNVENWYTGDNACAVFLNTNVKTYHVSGNLGGSQTGAVTGHNCIDGVRSASAYNAARNKVAATNGGLSGDLHVCNGKLMDRLLDDGSFEIVGSGNFTYDIRSTGRTIAINSALTADQTITMPTTGVPHGFEVRVYRTSGATGAFNSIISGLILSAANQYGIVKYYDGVGWLSVEKGVVA